MRSCNSRIISGHVFPFSYGALTTLRLYYDRYSPAILLLQDFEVFHNMASNEGLPNDQVGHSYEIASVIRKFTEPAAEDEDDYGEEEDGNLVSSLCSYPIFLSYYNILFLLFSVKQSNLSLIFYFIFSVCAI